MKLLLAAVLNLSFVCFGFAQHSLTTAELSNRVAAFKQAKNYSVEYDQSKNLTSVLLGAREPIKGARTYLFAGSLISFSVAFNFKGQTTDRQPDKFSLVFYFLDAPALDADKVRNLKLTDQKTVLTIKDGIIGEMSGTGRFGRKKKVQTLSFELRGEDLQAASEMPQLEIELGNDKFQLNREQRQIFKDIIAVSTF